jgi:hypothetical protein
MLEGGITAVFVALAFFPLALVEVAAGGSAGSEALYGGGGF